MALDDDLLDKLIEGYQKPEDLLGENGLLKQLTKRLIERAPRSFLVGFWESVPYPAMHENLTCCAGCQRSCQVCRLL